MKVLKFKQVKKAYTVTFALLFTCIAIYLGYIALGFWTAFIFTFGYLGGFILWLVVDKQPTFKHIRVAYFATLLLFILHKIEERQMDFFPELSKITGVPIPDASSLSAILLYAIASVWLFIPFLILKNYTLGYYLAWTYFTSMGIIELSHFVFPLFINQPYGYFPGMWTVIFLAPVAWYGMFKLSKNQ